MRVFSSPFLAQVYGDSDADIENFDQLISMFANPEKCSPTRKLIEKKRGLRIMEVLNFLEGYAYIFLSLAHF